MEKQPREKATDSAIELVIAAERQRCIDRVLTYAALREQAADSLDKAADGPGPEKPSAKELRSVRECKRTWRAT